MKLYALIGLFVAMLAATSWQTFRVMQLQDRAATAEADAAHWKGEAETAAQRLAQAQEARRIAEAARAHFAAQAAEYEALRRALTEGENDAPLPPWFIDYLTGLLRSGNPDRN